MDIRELIPAAFYQRPHAATRHLYFWEKPGHVTCVFQTHPLSRANPIHLKAYPAELEHSYENRARMTKNVYAISYVLEGTAEVEYVKEQQRYELEPGRFFIYDGHTMDDVVLHASPGLFECSACVDGDTGKHLQEIGLWNSGIRSGEVGLRPAVIQAYVNVYEHVSDPGSSRRSLLREFIELIELFDRIMESTDPLRRFREEARTLLVNNCGPGYKIQAAAEAMGLTYEAFRQRFLKAFGISPQEFQLRIRMERAVLLLLDHSVKETAAALGYTDPFIFSRQFSKRMGLPPREWGRT